MLSTATSLGWLLHQARREKIIPPGTPGDPDSLLPSRSVLAAFRERDPHVSAALVLRNHGGDAASPGDFASAFTLAAYRLYRDSLRLMTTGEELRALESLVRTHPADAVAAWLRKRTVPVRAARVLRKREGPTFSLLIPRVMNFRQRGRPASLSMQPGTCHVLISDALLRASQVVCPPPPVNIRRIPSAPRGFDDLSLNWNRRLCLLMQAGARGGDLPGKWLPADLPVEEGRKRLGDLPSGPRFLFHLAAAYATGAAACMIVEKPRLEEAQEVSFWHLASAMAQRGLALLVMAPDDSAIHHAHLVSVIRDGCLLGSLTSRAVDEAGDFSWVRCRVAEPARTRGIPPHHLKVTPLSGDVWMAVPADSLRNPHYETFLRERHGILLIRDRIVPATLEERLVKELKDLPGGEGGGTLTC